jgi:adhesin transport system outer membrane protein
MVMRTFPRLIKQILSGAIVLSLNISAGTSAGDLVQSPLSDVLTKALQDSPSIKAQRAQLAAADSDLKAAEWGRFPAISFTTQATQASSSQQVFSVEQPLWTGGRISSTISYADASKQQAEALLLSVQQQVLSDVSTAFFEILRLENRYEAAKENTAEHQRLVDLINRRVDLEVSPITDQVLARSRAELAKTEELQVLRQLQTARFQLNQLVGSEVGAIKPPTENELWHFNYESADEAMKVALNFSPILRQAQANIDGASAQVDLAKSSSYPSLVAGYQSVEQDVSGFTQKSNTSYVGLQFAPGSGLASLATSRAAESRRQAAVDSFAAAQNQVRAVVSAAYAESINLKSLVGPNKRFLQGMEEVLDSYMRQYQIGRKTWIDVLNSQREKTQSKVAFYDALYGLQASQLRLMFLTGDLRASNLQERLYD